MRCLNMNLNKDKNFISFIVYGSKHIQHTIDFLNKIDEFCCNFFEKYEFIVLNDDYYTDEQVNSLQSLSFHNSSQLNIIKMSYHQGLEKSMNAGVDFAIGDYVFEFDTTEIDYELETITNAYHICLNGADIVSASNGKNRHLSSKLFYSVFNRNSKNQYKISSNSFFLLSRRAINRLNSMSLSIPYRKAVYSNCGLRFESYIYSPIKKKVSDESKNDKKAVIADSLILYTDVFFKIGLVFTIIMTLLSIFSLTYTLVIFFTKNPTEGWTTTMLLISIGFTAIFMFMCVILVYLKIIINLNFQKQKYLIESIKKGNKE